MNVASLAQRLRRPAVLWTAGYAAALIAVVAAFLALFPPRRYEAPRPFARTYNRDVMQAAMQPESVRATRDAIVALGSRAPGQPGHEATRAWVAAHYRAAGLETLEHECDVAYPAVSNLELQVDGAPAAVGLWQAQPNFIQPGVTPAEGLTGELMHVTEESLRAATGFCGRIALVDLAQALPGALGLAPERYADLGFEAMIVSHSDGLDRVDWTRFQSFRLPYPLNYVRLVAEPRIFDHAGQRVRLVARSDYRPVAARNVLGVMRARDGESRRAVVIAASIDSVSVLPDRVGGPVDTLQLAVQLRLLEGLQPQRALLDRDVVFLATAGSAMAQAGLDALLGAVGIMGESSGARSRLEASRLAHETALAEIGRIGAWLAPTNSLVDAAAAAAALAAFDPQTRERFTEQYRYVLRRRVFDAAEDLLQARIAFERHPEALDSPAYRAFQEARRRHDRLNTQAALPLPRFLARKDRDGFDLRLELTERFAELKRHHATQRRRREQELDINARLGRYEEVLAIYPSLQPSDGTEPERETISFTSGMGIKHTTAATTFRRLLRDSAFALGLHDQLDDVFLGVYHGTRIQSTLARMPVYALPWAARSYPAFTVINPRRAYGNHLAPHAFGVSTNLAGIAVSLQVLGESVLALAHGYGRFPPLIRSAGAAYALRGAVFASGVGNAVVPNYPVAGALLTPRDPELGVFHQKPVLFTDPYGRYEQPQVTHPLGRWQNWQPFEAARFGADGRIAHFKDSGMAAQNIYQSRNFAFNGMPVNLILYRAAPVAVLDRVNPQSMRKFTDADFLRKRGLSPFASTALFRDGDALVAFINPAERFFLALKAGTPDNPYVAVTRSFCLNTRDAGFVPNPENEIDGAGYLAQDTPILRDVAAEAAHSMRFLAERRLALQQRYGMADSMTLAFHARGVQALEAAAQPDRPRLDRLRDERQALGYLVLNHPVIRGAISEAVWGILWYMGLLVPFMFFFEKLVFGFTDIRRQLAAQGAIFLVVFLLLRLLHPAFHMIRSSVMILLGFVIILIAAGITLVVMSKFRENLDALRRRQGAIRGAEVNKAGMLATAFMLGLNNMHRRRVRTGLTCATLVLMTFVMIGFTSVQDNVMDRERALGPAAYQGLLVRDKDFLPIGSAEIAALHSRYGAPFTVNERQALVGDYDTSQVIAPRLDVLAGKPPAYLRATARTALLFQPTEPLRHAIRLITTNGWFTQAHVLRRGPHPVLLPESMAGALGITAAAVDAGGVRVRINGAEYAVHGLFDAASLQACRDLDGDDLLPFDAEAVVKPLVLNRRILLAERDDPRVPAEETIIGLVGRFEPQHLGVWRTVSAAIDMGGQGQAAARRAIAAHRELTGSEVYYGLGGTAFSGRCARARSLGGLSGLLIPLIIAALTVLNTMKGSVYERRDEIFVYNAVGIAPRYIFFMFVAEALVYAVVGAVLGYLLSQGTGRILTALGWTGGLNMNFTSRATIYASLAIAAATIASTWFPARSAVAIARTADKAGWTLPPPDGDDQLTIDLPFTFTHFDRIAVLGFFRRYFEDLGEGSAGPFYAARPELGLSERTDPLAGDACIPLLQVQVWLKPFDLGVSQRIVIDLATDPATREYIARMRLIRLSGSREAWLRLNGPLVGRIRRHFLLWRAVPEDMKRDLHARARRELETRVARKEGAHGQG